MITPPIAVIATAADLTAILATGSNWAPKTLDTCPDNTQIKEVLFDYGESGAPFYYGYIATDDTRYRKRQIKNLPFEKFLNARCTFNKIK